MDGWITRIYSEHGELVIKWEDILFILININNYFHLTILVTKIIMKIRNGTSVSDMVREALDQLQRCLTEPGLVSDRFEEKNEITMAIKRLYLGTKSNKEAKQPTNEMVLSRFTKFKTTTDHAEAPLIDVDDKISAITRDDTKPNMLHIQTHDAICLEAWDDQPKDTESNLLKTASFSMPPDRKTTDKGVRLRSNSIDLIENYAEGSTNQLFREQETSECSMMQNSKDDFQSDERSKLRQTDAYDTRNCNLFKDALYNERSQNVDGLTAESENNDAEVTDETHLKTVWDTSYVNGLWTEHTHSLSDNFPETERSMCIHTEELYRKTRVVTSADCSELHQLLRQFFDTMDHGIKPQELLNRTFGVPIIVVEICRAPTNVSDDTDDSMTVIDSCPVFINSQDEACIRSYFESRGFRFHCRRENCFYFGVGNRKWNDSNAEISRMEGELRMLCFGRLYGRSVAGSRIESPREVEISFRDGRFEHSSRRFYFTLFENNKPVLISQTRHMRCSKLRNIYFLLVLVFFLVCLNKAPLRKL